MKIKLNLYISLILEAVKADTQIKGRIDRAASKDAVELAFHETAGDEEMHERKLVRSIYNSADRLRSIAIEFLDNKGNSIGNNIVNYEVDDDKIVFTLDVNPRFNLDNTDSLARLFSKYIEDHTLFLWWGPINQQQATYYSSLLGEDIMAIRALFLKRNPSTPTIPYTKNISVEENNITIYEGESVDIKYTIDDNAVDDVEPRYSQPAPAGIMRTSEDRTISIHGFHCGQMMAGLFSLHDERVSCALNITVLHDPFKHKNQYPSTHPHKHI